MDTFLSFLDTAWIILMVVLLFNFMIFVHELGHFWAARRRGLYVDRFQIWFGRPIWKKTINGVHWGLGWIPAGGFVSLPQLAPMEAIEGKADLPADLKPVKPIDKIIVAAAGPFFSFLLAVVFALAVWIIGMPVGTSDTTVVGYVPPSSPAAKAGLLPGDKILAVDGKPVTKWTGNMKGVYELIATSENDALSLLVERTSPSGEQARLTINSNFEHTETGWYRRSALRSIGKILPEKEAIIGSVAPQSPAATAGIRAGETISALNGTPLHHPIEISLASAKGEPLHLTVTAADGTQRNVDVTPRYPDNWTEDMKGATPLLGISWGYTAREGDLEHPTPWRQITESLSWMGETLEKLFAPKSDVSVEHLSGPIGIGSFLYSALDAPGGWRLALWFAVILNVNLAVLNILPLPVVDGGHVMLGLYEMIFRRPFNATALGIIQTAFVFLLMGLFLYISFKDVGDLVPGSSSQKDAEKLPVPVFSAPHS